MNKRKRFNTSSDTKANTVHLRYTTLLSMQEQSKDLSLLVVARLGLPDFAELMDLLILYSSVFFEYPGAQPGIF